MRTLDACHPAAAGVYFLCAAGIAMFCMDPVIIALSLAGALCCCLAQGCPGTLRSNSLMLLLFAVMTLINPLFSHRGQTVLLVMNHNPVTLEALLYGAAAAGMIVSVMYWFRSFTHVMTSDRLLCLFGALSPKLALVLSMAIRYAALFGDQLRKVQEAQTALGLYGGDSLTENLRGRLRVFSIMVTWALENGIITADSMSARGYGAGKRTQFTIFRFTAGDALLCLISLMLGAAALWAAQRRAFVFYPYLSASALDAGAWAGYAAYALLAMTPALIRLKEEIRWRCLRSRI